MGVAEARPHRKFGEVAPRAPMLKFLEITTGWGIRQKAHRYEIVCASHNYFHTSCGFHRIAK